MNAPNLPQRLTPPQTKGVTSVARVTDDWYVACFSGDLRRGRQLPLTLMGTPLVLFRGRDGALGALLDRCPHRNVPLSDGAVVGDHLQCGYHGWEFDAGGACRSVPGLVGEPGGKARCAPSYPVREQDGVVWVYATPDVEPEREPYRFPLQEERGYTTVRYMVEAQGSLHAVAENALDVPHTAFLHKGLFRGTGTTNELKVDVRRWHDRVEAEYIGEPPPRGLAARILAVGKTGTVTHFDRFFLPCVAQVEYRLGERSHFCVSAALTPVGDFHTRLFAVISFRMPLPGWLVRLFLTPVGKWIFSQDARVLARQTGNVQAFGGEQFASTDLDVLGQHILSLLRAAERGDRAPLEEPQAKTISMIV
jgi:phenylpropionate dioxygenase-like ring-hydroxylating dioxygenase large terminal subunit